MEISPDAQGTGHHTVTVAAEQVSRAAEQLGLMERVLPGLLQTLEARIRHALELTGLTREEWRALSIEEAEAALKAGRRRMRDPQPDRNGRERITP